jgi:hypothetical protein
VADFREHDNETPGSINERESLIYLSDYYLLKKESDSWG